MNRKAEKGGHIDDGKNKSKGTGKNCGRASRVSADTKKFYYERGVVYVENVIIH